MDDLIRSIAIYAIPVIFAITLHEAAHGYAARALGDPTAWQMGRISLNPARHIDPVGTLLVPLLILLASKLLGSPGLLFGWAKPVPVDFARLRRPKKDMLWVAAAGPGANLLMAILWAIVLRLLSEAGGLDGFWLKMASAGVMVNLVLMALNLLPVLPLDGGRIVFSLLPHKLAWQYSRIEPYGTLIVLLLLFSGSLSYFMHPFLALGGAIVSWFL
ncbi:site-2 protease family protein [Bordetella genomosp. 10]|uniref:Site-2 protease family protein n=1 Tax=Bordetella genomosp. 10 TaxID=1416804 RepID=A0A261RZR5_9BORD|nr:site-2 protease family protein [Bordetella genomosp. 10]OZI30584.1 site-2 protease family protein [Bordetella genomosp. 10]